MYTVDIASNSNGQEGVLHCSEKFFTSEVDLFTEI